MIGRLRCALAAAALAVFAPAAAEEPSPLPVTEIAPGVFVHEGAIALADAQNRGDIANAGFIVGHDGVAVVDTLGSLAAGRRLLAAVRSRTALPIRFVINTHVHPDHVFGNAAFRDSGAAFVGHAQLPAALAARAPFYLTANRALIGDAFAGSEIVPPTVLVAQALELDLGGRKLLLEAWPTAHTNTDLTVRDLATDTWFLGDLLFSGHVPALDGKLAGWRTTLTKLAARPAARVVPGHGPATLPWPAAAAPIERYLAALDSDVRTSIKAGTPLQDATAAAARGEAQHWSLFKDFNARNATTAYQELEWSE